MAGILFSLTFRNFQKDNLINKKKLMKHLKYSIEIDAPKEKVWDVLWNTKTYNQWTAFFSPGSSFETDWKVGGDTRFIDADSKDGMISTIKELKENELVNFEHLGMIKDGIVDKDSDEVKQWSGITERYELIDNNGKTQLNVDTKTSDDYVDFMNQGFEKGLNKTKELSEQ